MSPFQNILICTDLDGTLLRDDTSISEENLNAIRRFQAGGGYFTFVTGRMPYYITDFVSKVKPNAPLGCVNGGGIYDTARNIYIWREELPRAAFDIADAVRRAFPDLGTMAHSFTRVYVSHESGGTDHFFERSRTTRNRLPYRDITEPVAKFMFADLDDSVITRLAAFLEDLPAARDYTLVRTERTLFEILPRGVNKGTVLPHLEAHLGIPHARTIAVGDYDNDIPMLRTAAIGIAVANAIPAARAVADRITVSNEEHAIARIIEEIESGEITFSPS